MKKKIIFMLVIVMVAFIRLFAISAVDVNDWDQSILPRGFQKPMDIN